MAQVDEMDADDPDDAGVSLDLSLEHRRFLNKGVEYGPFTGTKGAFGFYGERAHGHIGGGIGKFASQTTTKQYDEAHASPLQVERSTSGFELAFFFGGRYYLMETDEQFKCYIMVHADYTRMNLNWEADVPDRLRTAYEIPPDRRTTYNYLFVEEGVGLSYRVGKGEFFFHPFTALPVPTSNIGSRDRQKDYRKIETPFFIGIETGYSFYAL